MGSPPADRAARPPTVDLPRLVWGIEREVAAVTGLSDLIDAHVRVLNGLRADAAHRLELLDELLEVAEDDRLRAWLEAVASPPLPQVTEHFPDRLYTD